MTWNPNHPQHPQYPQYSQPQQQQQQQQQQLTFQSAGQTIFTINVGTLPQAQGNVPPPSDPSIQAGYHQPHQVPSQIGHQQHHQHQQQHQHHNQHQNQHPYHPQPLLQMPAGPPRHDGPPPRHEISTAGGFSSAPLGMPKYPHEVASHHSGTNYPPSMPPPRPGYPAPMNLPAAAAGYPPSAAGPHSLPPTPGYPPTATMPMPSATDFIPVASPMGVYPPSSATSLTGTYSPSSATSPTGTYPPSSTTSPTGLHLPTQPLPMPTPMHVEPEHPHASRPLHSARSRTSSYSSFPAPAHGPGYPPFPGSLREPKSRPYPFLHQESTSSLPLLDEHSAVPPLHRVNTMPTKRRHTTIETVQYEAPPPAYSEESDRVLAMRIAMEELHLHSASKEGDKPPTSQHQPGASSETYPSPSHSRYTSISSAIRTITFTDSTDRMPQLFLIAPPLNDSFIKVTNNPFRILVPCQAPSLLEGGREDSIHLTEHEGYTIRAPRDLIHGSRGAIAGLNAFQGQLASGVACVSYPHGLMIDPSPLIKAPLARLHQISQNRVHMRRVGLEPLDLYSRHEVMDNSQIENMRKLFANAGHANSDGNMTFPLRAIRHERTTKWVCEECYQLLPHAEEIVVDHLVSLEEYADLSSRVEEVEVTLRCSASVNIFKKSVENNSKLRKAVIHIKSGYFYTPERRQGSQYATIKNQFNELGKALKDRSLTRIEIRGDGYEDRSEGYENRESVFAGLQRVFKCSDLRSIFISGMPDFLRGADIPINACKLELIVLDQVYINTAETANNLIRLLASNSVLKQLRLSNSQLTLTAMTVLERNERARESFKKLSRLYISHNSFGLSTAVTLVAMALQGNCLTHLDISHCPGVRDAGCSEIVEKLRLYRTGRRLEVIATDGTGISAETEAKMDCFRIRSKFTE